MSGEEVYPRPFTSAVEVHMNRIANALLEFQAVEGSLPAGPNAAMVRELQRLNPRAFWKRELNAQGEVIDPWNRPYFYLSPGTLYPSLFDLYSVGPTAAGATNPGERIVCELMRL